MSRFTKKGKQNQCLHVSYQREQKGEATGQNAQLESASPGMHTLLAFDTRPSA